MSNMRDGPVLKAVADVVKQHVGAAFAGLRGRIDGLEAQIKSLPQPEKGEKGDRGESIKGDKGEPGESIKGEPGKDAEPVDIEKIIKSIVAQIPIPKNGEPGKNGESIKGDPGKDAPAVDEEALATKILSKIPVPKDGTPGKDASPIDQDALTASILAKIPVPANGLPGKDAPAVDIKALSDDIVQKVLGAIPKPKDGEPGKDGASVDLDAVRFLIAGEVSKAVGEIPKPKDGKKGDPGIAGKDADEIDVLPGIDEGSAYPKGTRAEYRGGEIRAIRTTDPIADGDIEAAGWTVTRNGISDIVEEMAPDGRTRITSYVMTNGKSVVTKLKMYVPQHKGVWSASNAYELGDYVTMAGAQWHSNRTNKDRPGTSDAWTLVVKRGSDGKDLTNGTRQ